MSRSYIALRRASAIAMTSTSTPSTRTMMKTAANVSCFSPTTSAPTQSANNGAPVQMLTARKAVAALIATRLRSSERVESGAAPGGVSLSYMPISSSTDVSASQLRSGQARLPRGLRRGAAPGAPLPLVRPLCALVVGERLRRVHVAQRGVRRHEALRGGHAEALGEHRAERLDLHLPEARQRGDVRAQALGAGRIAPHTRRVGAVVVAHVRSQLLD